MASNIKPFFKITFQDLEIAEEFFENEKHFSEFILAVSYYYRGKYYQIKNKNVQKYFKTYEKTMDFIMESKAFGKKGAEIKAKIAEKQDVKENTLEGLLETPLEGTLPTNNKVISVNDKEIINTNIMFSKIKDFKTYLSSFNLNKSYFLIAYKFWKLWEKENPNNKTIQDAKVSKWYDAIRLIIDVDKQPIDRILVIYFYFEKCQQDESGFDRFWFDTIKSVGALRVKDKFDVYRIDKIIDIVNRKINQDPSFRNLVGKKIKDFERYESTELH